MRKLELSDDQVQGLIDAVECWLNLYWGVVPSEEIDRMERLGRLLRGEE